MRVAESNIYSTPVFHGELVAFKKNLLEEVGGFPTDIGADDSHTATLVALKGHRAVVTRDLVCTEAVPRKGYHTWRVRRAQHLIQHFAKTAKQPPKAPKRFKLVLATETFLHLVNPPDTANSNSTSTNPIGVGTTAIQAIQNMDNNTTIPTSSYDKKPVDKRDRLEKNREVRHSSTLPT